MGYYERKSLIEAIYRDHPTPDGLPGYFRVIKEAYAHSRFDLACSLCDALVLTRQPGQDRGAPPAAASNSERQRLPTETSGEDHALEAIRRALECLERPVAPLPASLSWQHFSGLF